MPIQIAKVTNFGGIKKYNTKKVIMVEAIKIPLRFKKIPLLIAPNILLGGLSAFELA